MFYSSKQLKIQWGIDGNTFKKRLQSNLRTNKLTKIRKGLYVETITLPFLTENDWIYAGNLSYSPSYLSFETVLQEAGAIFQYDSSLTYAGPYTKEIILKKYKKQFSYKRLPASLLTTPLGIIHYQGVSKATPERALCDIFWYDPHYPLDSLKLFDKKQLKLLSELYGQFKPHIRKRILELFSSI